MEVRSEGVMGSPTSSACQAESRSHVRRVAQICLRDAEVDKYFFSNSPAKKFSLINSVILIPFVHS